MPPVASFELRYPAWISFGWGNRQEVSRILAERFSAVLPSVYLVASRSALTEARRAELQALCGDRIVGVFCQVPHDPPLAVVDAAACELRRTGASAVLAMGGGSVLDTAKAAAIIAPTGKPVRSFFSAKNPAMIAAGIFFELLQNKMGHSNILTAIFRKTAAVPEPMVSLLRERTP